MLSISNGKDSDLLQAIKSDDIQTVEKLLLKYKVSKPKRLGIVKKRIDINIRNSDGSVGLHQAALRGNASILRLLLEAGAKLDLEDDKGMQPIHYASWQGDPECIAFLLKFGASPNCQAHSGETPLHLACRYGHLEVARLLIRYQSEVLAQDLELKTPLHLACEFGHYKLVELLLEGGKCASLLDEKPCHGKSTTCLHLAARNGHVGILNTLLNAGANPNQINLHGTPLHEAAMHGKLEAARTLLQWGADPGLSDSRDQTPLDLVRSFATGTAEREMKLLLKEALESVKAQAIRDYNDPSDPTCLPLKEGQYVTVLEQGTGGRWRGMILRTSLSGYFPATVVQLLDRPIGMKTRGAKKVPPPIIPDRNSGSSFSSGRGSFYSPDEENCPSTVSSPQPVNYFTSDKKEKSQLVSSFDDQGIEICPSPEGSSSSSRHSICSLDSARTSINSQDAELISSWLSSFNYEEYVSYFLQAGYDMPTISRMTPEDLTAIGITKPTHRQKLKDEIVKLNISDGIPYFQPNSLLEWLRILRLEEYYETLCSQNYDSIEKVLQLTWEDLEEIGIQKLGHQKKIILAIKRIKFLSKNTLQSNFFKETLDRRKHLSTLSCSSALASTSSHSYYSQEVAITTNAKNSPSIDPSLELKTFQQLTTTEIFSQSQIKSDNSNYDNTLFQPNVITIQVKSPSRGRSLESLEDADDSVSTCMPYSDCWYDKISAWRHNGYDTDSELSVNHLPHENDGTKTLHRPKVMVKPIAKIMAKVRCSDPSQTNIRKNPPIPPKRTNSIKDNIKQEDVFASCSKRLVPQFIINDELPCPPPIFLSSFKDEQSKLCQCQNLDESNMSISNMDSSSLPFANENVGTIKQRTLKITNETCSFKEKNKEANISSGNLHLNKHYRLENKPVISDTTDVIVDIENMLESLSTQLDEMLSYQLNEG